MSQVGSIGEFLRLWGGHSVIETGLKLELMPALPWIIDM